jgi:hypothetical protein
MMKLPRQTAQISAALVLLPGLQPTAMASDLDDVNDAQPASEGSTSTVIGRTRSIPLQVGETT